MFVYTWCVCSSFSAGFCLVAKKLLVKKMLSRTKKQTKKSINSDNSKNETIVPQLCHLFPYLALNELL